MKLMFALLAFTYCFNFNAMESGDQTSKKNEKQENHVDFTQGNKPVTKLIDKETYRTMVDKSIICCVDVVVYDPVTRTYLTIIRRNRPAKECRFVIGGRQLKNESFFDSARRKCLEEAQIHITPVCVLRTYSTIFPDSEWLSENGEVTTTHSVNTVVLAILRNDSPAVHVNDEHEAPQWLPIGMSPSHPEINRPGIFEYFNALYNDAMTVIETHQTELERLYYHPNEPLEISRDEAIRRLERQRIQAMNPVQNNHQQNNASTGAGLPALEIPRPELPTPAYNFS